MPTEDDRDQDVIAEEIRRKEAQNRAQVLEMIGDLPEADAKPPPNMIFVCKLNPVTTEEVRVGVDSFVARFRLLHETKL